MFTPVTGAKIRETIIFKKSYVTEYCHLVEELRVSSATQVIHLLISIPSQNKQEISVDVYVLLPPFSNRSE